MGRVITSMLILFAVAVVVGGKVRAADESPERVAADFRMERTLVALADKIESSGKLYLGGPGLLRFEMTSPSRSILVVNRGKAWIHYPDLSVTKGFDLSTDPVMKVLSEHLLVLTAGAFDELGKLYHVSDGDRETKRLIPKQAAVKRVFAELWVKLGQGGVISWVELISTSGDRTRLDFVNVRVNPNLDPDLFERPDR